MKYLLLSILFVAGCTSVSTPVKTSPPVSAPSPVPTPDDSDFATFDKQIPILLEPDCKEGACICNNELLKIAGHQIADLNAIKANQGPDDPHQVFISGGSLNIPTMCRAAKYHADNDPTWFQKYFSEQLTQTGFMGTEVLSPLYGPFVVGAVLEVLHNARKNKHASLISLSNQWLRTYWSLYALEAVKTPFLTVNIVTGSSVFSPGGNGNFFNGLSVGLQGSRIRKGGSDVGDATIVPLTTWALDYTPRKYTWNILSNVQLALIASFANVDVDSKGKLNFAATVPANVIGLLESERATLKDFVNGNYSNVGTVLSYIKPYTPACDMTFMRTSQGVIGWFGTDTTQQNICNTNKGPYFAATITNTGVGTYLHPNNINEPAEASFSFRKGNQLCATIEDKVPFTKCIDILPGNLIYEVTWTKQGVVLK